MIANEINRRLELSKIDATDLKGIVDRLQGKVGNALYRDFEDLPLGGLLWQLIPLCDSTESKDELRALIKAFDDLQRDEKTDFCDGRKYEKRLRAAIETFLDR